MSGGVTALRLPTAGRLLEIRREMRGRTDDELERAALCNAQVLAEACLDGEGNRVYDSAEAALAALTFPEMESLLSTLGGTPKAENPNFDSARFAALGGE